MAPTAPRYVSSPMLGPRVAIWMTDSYYGREVVDGIARFLRPNPHWEVYVVRGPDRLRRLKRWKPDAAIVHARDAADRRALLRLGVPIIGTSDETGRPLLPTVSIDAVEAARRVIAHLHADCGLQRLAYFGWPRPLEEDPLGRAFTDLADAAGTPAASYQPSRRFLRAEWTYERELHDLERWLQSLDLPVGLLARHDQLAEHLLHAAGRLGITVPENMTVVGVENDPVVCELAPVALSSLALDADRVGFRAAELLDRMLAGSAPPDGPIRLPPGQLVVRRSSERFPLENPLLAEVRARIRRHAGRGISAEQLVADLPYTRRWIDQTFRQATGRTVAQELRAERLQRAATLLRETDLTTDAIAARTGFSSKSHLTTAFKTTYALTPSQYRRSS